VLSFWQRGHTQINIGEEEMSHWNCILSDDRSSTAYWHTLRSREECDQVRLYLVRANYKLQSILKKNYFGLHLEIHFFFAISDFPSISDRLLKPYARTKYK
jgi:hypothetical protein